MQEPGTEEISFSGENRPLDAFSTKQVDRELWNSPFQHMTKATNSSVMHCLWPAGNTQDCKEQGQINICKQGRLTPARLAHPTSENWMRRSKMLSQSGEESCNCIIFLDEQCQWFWLWVSPEPVNALWRSLGHCAIRSDDFHNRLLSRIQTQIHFERKENHYFIFQ